ncbi:cation acetate symporter [uncultured Desulfuromonas sp.]|uniref:sodium/solute symporter n=1 Tax=uncultured Desulfuromonas sp. TaxID=181013 RepID=UPI002AAC1F75|nr:cation acetate symporter [uncultured Desulfuromonas sp.]
MINTQEPLAVALFLCVVAVGIGLSTQLVRRTTSPSEYFVAGGSIHWAVNGLAFIGDYLSAASFLGVGGLIATVGYDGFLYSIGFLAGWAFALLVVAEPFRRFGRVTFTDVIDARFRSRGVRFTAAVSTLVICLCYLIPQMVGVGTLVTPLLGIPYYLGILLIGTVVTIIVATSGMASTTYVQCLKGIALLTVSSWLAFAVLERGLIELPPSAGEELLVERGQNGYRLPDGRTLEPGWSASGAWQAGFLPIVEADGRRSLWQVDSTNESEAVLIRSHYSVELDDGMMVDGVSPPPPIPVSVGRLAQRSSQCAEPSLNPITFLRCFSNSELYVWNRQTFIEQGQLVTAYRRERQSGGEVLSTGGLFDLPSKNWASRLDFISLMVALLCGTAALPHILIRYYTVGNHSAARKSTVLAIAGICLFYCACLIMSLGAMSGQAVNLLDSNMTIPLLAKTLGTAAFAVVTAVAFAAVLGSVSGLIIAASGAVAHDLMDCFLGITMNSKEKVVVGRMSAFIVGCGAIYFGLIFEGMNVSYLAGLTFALAAAANLPALLMALFWSKTTGRAVVCSMLTGLVGSFVLILISPEMYVRYGRPAADAPFALNNPALVMLPVSLLVLILISKRYPDPRSV